MFLEVRDLNKYYNSRNLFSKEKKQILKDVTFDVKEGEIFSIIGQSCQEQENLLLERYF